MALTQYTADTDIIETLGTNPEDRPTLTDNTFKGKFDENAANIKAFLNAMITELASTANGKGASQIGIEDSAGRYTATQIEAALAEIAGAGRTTETVKGLATLISTQATNLTTETALRNTQALQADTTIYVATTGNDTTGTGLVGAPYATIQKASNMIPKNLNGHTVIVSVSNGTYAGATFQDFVNGKITLTATTLTINTGIVFSRCQSAVLDIGGTITVTGGIGIYASENTALAINKAVTVSGCTIGVRSDTGSDIIANSTVTINTCGTGLSALVADIRGLFAGTGNTYGYNANQGTIYTQDASTLTGTTKLIKGNGGMIKTGAGVDLT